MTASLGGAWAKVGRAEHHFEMLECEIARFVNEHPVRVTVNRDLEQSAYIFHVHDVADIEVDPGWGLTLGDCVHNARTALDHLVYQLAVANLGRVLTDKEAKSVMFPVYEQPGEVPR